MRQRSSYAIGDTLKAFAALSLETGGKQSGRLQIRVEDHVADASVEVEPAAVGEMVVVLLSEATRHDRDG